VVFRGLAAFSAHIRGKIWRLKNLGLETGGKWRPRNGFGNSGGAQQLWGKAPLPPRAREEKKERKRKRKGLAAARP